MEASRTEVATEIVKSMDKYFVDYPLEAGLRDIIYYYDAGSLNAGVAALSKAAGDNKKKAHDSLNKARGLPTPSQ
jgi:hypothetical protein